jgi:hypothetical protein
LPEKPVPGACSVIGFSRQSPVISGVDVMQVKPVELPTTPSVLSKPIHTSTRTYLLNTLGININPKKGMFPGVKPYFQRKIQSPLGTRRLHLNEVAVKRSRKSFD